MEPAVQTCVLDRKGGNPGPFGLQSRALSTERDQLGHDLASYLPNGCPDCTLFVNTITGFQRGYINVSTWCHLFSFLHPSETKFCGFCPSSSSDVHPHYPLLPPNPPNSGNAIPFSVRPFLQLKPLPAHLPAAAVVSSGIALIQNHQLLVVCRLTKGQNY